ncbi:MAG: LPS assembly lipoprotein LptE [Rhodocyclaceae bacterium]
MRVTLAAFAFVLALLAGCGFQLRGAYALPYESIYLALPSYSEIGAGLKRAIRASGSTRLVESVDEAQARFVPNADLREKVVLSFSGTGRVRELRLRYRYAYRIVDAKGRDLVPAGEIELTRDLTYDDSNVLAKEQEETLLWRDMQNDMVQQIMRRLAAVKPVPPALAE